MQHTTTVCICICKIYITIDISTLSSMCSCPICRGQAIQHPCHNNGCYASIQVHRYPALPLYRILQPRHDIAFCPQNTNKNKFKSTILTTTGLCMKPLLSPPFHCPPTYSFSWTASTSGTPFPLIYQFLSLSSFTPFCSYYCQLGKSHLQAHIPERELS